MKLLARVERRRARRDDGTLRLSCGGAARGPIVYEVAEADPLQVSAVRAHMPTGVS